MLISNFVSISKLFILLLLIWSVIECPSSVQGQSQVENVPMRDDGPVQQIYERVWKLVAPTLQNDSCAAKDWIRWKDRYSASLRTPEDAYKACETMLATLNGKAYLETRDEGITDVAWFPMGIGVKFHKDSEGRSILTPIDASPAKNAGIKDGDLLVAVNKQWSYGISNQEIRSLIEGYPGSKVELLVIRKGVDPKTIRVKRSFNRAKWLSTQMQKTPTKQESSSSYHLRHDGHWLIVKPTAVQKKILLLEPCPEPV